jgi:methanogenic corrinoid protein MtbC1
VATGNLYPIHELVQDHLQVGEEPMACLEAMIAGPETTGQRFEAGACFVPALIMAADTCKAGVEVVATHTAGAPCD